MGCDVRYGYLTTIPTVSVFSEEKAFRNFECVCLLLCLCADCDFFCYLRVVIDDCYPYTSGNGQTGECLLSGSSQCPSGSGTTKLYHGASAYSVSSNEEAIRQEIYKHGPVEAAFLVYQDFYSYQQGIYEHVGGQKVGGHAVKILGWGSQDSEPYWVRGGFL